MWSWVLAFNLVRCLLCEAASEAGCSPYELSFTTALAVLEAALAWPAGDDAGLAKWVLARVGANRLPRRANRRRDEPRRTKPRQRADNLLRQPRHLYREHRRCRAG
ncbi:MAG: hypothetical protein IT204_17045 [Fimbriimonadaceae bacterium]|nr:hypothetical protein [Fimbriimonadaceae bacterium]